jgi:hypothetical protein
MSTYFYAGTFTEIGGVAEGLAALHKFGQSIELSDELAVDVILGGGTIVPKASWDSIGFTEQEISLYSNVYTHATAPAAFLTKKRKAVLACHALRLSLQSGKTLAEAIAAPPAVAEKLDQILS